MTVIPYQRDKAVDYARRWALSRNPAYYDFDTLGGDCTNFISQCVYAGSGVMNSTTELGWYYYGLNARAPAWTGVEFLHRFLINNSGAGPFAHAVAQAALQPGDVIQLGQRDGAFYHSLLVLDVRGGDIRIACHTQDALDRPLRSYRYDRARFLHILGARV